MLRLTLLAAFLLVSPSIVSAQNQAARSARDEKADAATEQKVFDLLETIAGRLESLHASSNRVRAESAIADLLWTRDEKRARALFKTASEEIKALTADLDFSDQETHQEIQSAIQLRQEMINRISQRDPELALSILRETRLPLAADSRWSWYTDTETTTELNLASLIAARDPQRSLELARANMKQGVTKGALGFLSSLQQKDQNAAQILYREMVELIKTEDLQRDQNLSSAAWNLLVMFQPPLADEATYRDLISTLTGAALALTPNNQNNLNMAQNLLYQITSLMPQIEKYAPGRVSALRQWSESIERRLDPWARMNREMNTAQTVDDVLALAAKYSPEMQNQIYQNAAWKAFSAGDINRAREIASELISDPVQRRQMLEQFDEQLANRVRNEDQITAARRRMSKIRSPERKAQILMQLASSLSGKKDKLGALDLLNEASSLIPAPARNSQEVLAQIQLARMYASLDLNQGFTILQPLVAKANELVAAAAVLDGFENRYLTEGEWVIPAGNNVGNLVTGLQESLAMLAQYDFDRAVTLSEQLERPEIRLMCQLQIAQAALSGKPTGMRGYKRSQGFIVN